MTPELPGCCICGRSCIPLADYDAPTCIDCDDVMLAITLRAAVRVPPPVTVLLPVTTVCHRCRVPDVDPADLDLSRPRDTYFGPADPDQLALLVDELCPTTNRKITGAAA